MGNSACAKAGNYQLLTYNSNTSSLSYVTSISNTMPKANDDSNRSSSIGSILSWNHLKTFHFGSDNTGITGTGDLDANMLTSVQNIFDSMIDDIFHITGKLLKRWSEIDANYIENFRNYCCWNDQFCLKHPDDSTYRHERHICHILFFHRKVIEAYKNNKDEGDELLKMLALRHAVLKISVQDFKMLSLALVVCLNNRYFEAVDDEKKKAFFMYLDVVTTFTCNSLLQCYAVANNSEFDSEDCGYKARENYRLIKKWMAIGDSIKEIYGNVPQQSFESESKFKMIEPNDIITETALEQENTKCFSCFKK